MHTDFTCTAEDELIAHTRKVHQHLSVAATNAERRAAAAARARAGKRLVSLGGNKVVVAGERVAAARARADLRYHWVRRSMR
eukprot:1148515-Pelagomonas_calceolata.AAC.4